MIDIIEFADNFIRGLYDGSILYYDIRTDSLPTRTTWVSSVDEQSKTLVDSRRTILNDNIDLFLTDPDNQREQYAKQIFESVLVLRRLGVIQNNPNSLKELNFYKQGYYDELKTSDDLRRKFKEAMDKKAELQTQIESFKKGNPIAK